MHMRMHAHLLLAGLCSTLLALTACDRVGSDPPSPRAESAAAEVVTPAPAVPTSVPPADSVMAPARDVPPPDATAGRSNSTMSRAEESTAMPMPGQNNDHSAPVVPAKRASGP